MYAYRQQPGSAMHKPFSLRRLQGLDAKVQRLNYLRRELPALEYEARYDLFFTCLFAMQGCQKSLNREDLATAKKKIRGILDEITPLGPNPEATALRNVLLKLAQVSFTGTSRLLNLLILFVDITFVFALELKKLLLGLEDLFLFNILTFRFSLADNALPSVFKDNPFEQHGTDKRQHSNHD